VFRWTWRHQSRRKMAVVQRIADAHGKKVEEALQVMLKKNREGRLSSLLFIAEEIGTDAPIYGLVGRFRREPSRAIGHLAILKVKLAAYAAESMPDLEENSP
jgi:hypothetical protein